MPQTSPRGVTSRPWTPSAKRMRSWTTAHPPGPRAPGRRRLGPTTTSSPTMKTLAQTTLTPPHLSSTERPIHPTEPPPPLGRWPCPATSAKSSWIRRTRPTRGCAPATAPRTAPRTAPWRRLTVTPGQRKMPWSPGWLSWSWRGWWWREASSPAAWAACRTPPWPACPSAPRPRPRPAWWPAAPTRDGRPATLATSTARPATPRSTTTQAVPPTATQTPTTAVSSRPTSQAHSPPPTPPWAWTSHRPSPSPPAAAAAPRLPPSTTRTCSPSAWETRGRASSEQEPDVFWWVACRLLFSMLSRDVVTCSKELEESSVSVFGRKCRKPAVSSTRIHL